MPSHSDLVKLDYAVPARPERIHPVFWIFAALVLAGLAWSVIPFESGNRGERARATAARIDVANIQAALEDFEVDTGRLPTAGEGLAALVSPPTGLDRWRGPYLRRIPIDA